MPQKPQDIFHVWRTLKSYCRATAWRLVLSVLRAPVEIAFNLRCFGWPEITHMRGGRLAIGEGCQIGKSKITILPGASVTIGKNTSINEGFFCASSAFVQIGANCMIGELVSIRDYDHNFSTTCEPMKQQGFFGEGISIGDDVWIGRGAAILKGVKIGSGAVVGANAVVVSDIPSYTIVGGGPAKIIRHRRSQG